MSPFGEGLQIAALRMLQWKAVVEGVLVGVGDLDDVLLRFEAPVFGNQKPALLKDAAISVAGHLTLINDGVAPAVT